MASAESTSCILNGSCQPNPRVKFPHLPSPRCEIAFLSHRRPVGCNTKGVFSFKITFASSTLEMLDNCFISSERHSATNPILLPCCLLSKSERWLNVDLPIHYKIVLWCTRPRKRLIEEVSHLGLVKTSSNQHIS